MHHDVAEAWLTHGDFSFATWPVPGGSLGRLILREGQSGTVAASLLAAMADRPRHVFWPDDIAYRQVDLRSVIGHRQVTDAYISRDGPAIDETQPSQLLENATVSGSRDHRRATSTPASSGLAGRTPRPIPIHELRRRHDLDTRTSSNREVRHIAGHETIHPARDGHLQEGLVVSVR